MLATLGGILALIFGLLLLLLPLLAGELSRARDSVWGAVVLLLGLVLVTSADRLTGAPMLAVLCGGLLMGRLGVEVGQGRWRQLTEEEQRRLGSAERWLTSLGQIGASLGRLAQLGLGLFTGLGAWLAERRAPKPATTKRWVRPEEAAAAPAAAEPAAPAAPAAAVAMAEAAPEAAEAAETEVTATAAVETGEAAADALEPLAAAAGDEPEQPTAEQPLAEEPTVVSSFTEIDALLDAAVVDDPAPAVAEPTGRGEAG